MTLRQLVRNVVPAPRKPLQWWDALPLLLFLALFIGGCLYVDLTNRLLFVRPAAFGLLAFSVWVWWMHVAGYAGLTKARGLCALAIRFVLLGLFVLVIAEPRAVRTKDVLSVIYALDVSDSIGDGSVDAALRFVAKNVTTKPQKDEAGLIVFGRNAAVELPPRATFPLEALNAQIDRDATNLEQSLSLAAAMLPEENQGR